jgi:hypothetical protein
MATARKKIGKRDSTITTKQIPGLSGKGVVRIGGDFLLELRDRLKMDRNLFCRVVGVSLRTIAKVEGKAEEVKKLQRPYNEVFRLTAALSEVVNPRSIGTWFAVPNEQFNGLKPVEVIERGEIDRLWEMVFRLRSGIPG